MDDKYRIQLAKAERARALAEVWRERSKFVKQILRVLAFLAAIPALYFDQALAQAVFSALQKFIG